MSLVNYRSTRLTFRKAVIDQLSLEDTFRIEIPTGIFEFTKDQFLRIFPNVAVSMSYLENGIYHYSTIPRKALEYFVGNGNGPHVPDGSTGNSSYALPEVLHGRVNTAEYRRWIHVKAAAHVKRDAKRWGRKLSISAYKKAIHQAVIQHNGTDPYTGEELSWNLLRTYNNDASKLGRTEYKRKFRLLPTIDHIDNGACDVPVFQVLSWEVNAAKNDMTHDLFVALCRRIIEHSATTVAYS